MVRTRPSPEIKKSNPNMPNMVKDFTSLVPPVVLENIIAAYISPPIPKSVSIDPKTLLIFI